MASPTKTRACTVVIWVSRLAWAMILPIWVWPPRQSMRSISALSRSACEPPRRARPRGGAAKKPTPPAGPATPPPLAENTRRKPTSRIPHGLTAHGRVEGEDEPPSPAGFGGRSKALHLGEESVDLRARG